MEQCDGHAATGPSPVVAIHHAYADRAHRLAKAVSDAGFRAALLPPLAIGTRSWRDCGFDLLVVDPFHVPAPLEFVLLARGIAGGRPLLVLSDRDSIADRMTGFDGGADDAVGWGDDPAEVTARIAGLLRRSRMTGGQLDCDELQIDLIDRRVERAGRPIRLPLREFDLLANLARVPDRPVSRTALLKAVWHIDFDPGTNRVEVHMSRLRAKVDRDFPWPMLCTVKGHGYALRSRPD